MKTTITARLEALAAQPREWRVTTHYADGSTKAHDTHTEAGAQNFALGECRKIGKALISRTTGETVHVVRVSVGRAI